MIRLIKRRVRVWGPLFLLLFVPLLVFLLRDNKERCHHFVSRKVLFKNCNGCFSVSHYPVIINQPQICATSTNQTIDVVFVVFTKPKDVEKRNLIRRTWASASRNNTSNFRHVFVLGTSEKRNLTLAVRKESQTYGDVVLTGFQDSYLNLTLKTMTALRWLSHYCSHARFFQKIDDDVWLNTKALLPALNKHASALNRGLGGHLRRNADVERHRDSKWYASCNSYADNFYPDYVHGPTYVGSLQLARRLSASCQDVPFFHMEDVFLGLCQEFLGLGGFPIQELKLWRYTKRDCEGKNNHVAVVYPVTDEQMIRYWHVQPCPMETSEKSWFIAKRNWVYRKLGLQ